MNLHEVNNIWTSTMGMSLFFLNSGMSTEYTIEYYNPSYGPRQKFP